MSATENSPVLVDALPPGFASTKEEAVCVRWEPSPDSDLTQSEAVEPEAGGK